MKRKFMFLAVLAVFVLTSGADLLYSQEIATVRRAVDYSIKRDSSDVSHYYTRNFATHPSIYTFVNSDVGYNDGSVTVCVSDDDAKMTHIYEYTADLAEIKTFSFKNELDMLGAFTKDNDGNYYFFYGKNTESKTENNMAMVKYDRNGRRGVSYRLVAAAPNSSNGIKKPFDAGTCRLEISGSMLAVYFAREMFQGSDGLSHQGSWGFVLNKDTFARIDREGVTDKAALEGSSTMYSVSHSFSQYILPIDKGFIFADLGDGYPRAFAFAKFESGGSTRRLNTFTFPGAIGENVTYSELGGIAKTSTGYIFTGTNSPDFYKNQAVNLFTLTMDENFTFYTKPVFLTSFTVNEKINAAHPKIAALGSGKYILMWELLSAEITGRSGHISTHLAIIDERGSLLTEPIKLDGVRLSMTDVMRYNSTNGKVYWTINDGRNSIVINALDVSKLSSGIRANPTAVLVPVQNEIPPPAVLDNPKTIQSKSLRR